MLYISLYIFLYYIYHIYIKKKLYYIIFFHEAFSKYERAFQFIRLVQNHWKCFASSNTWVIINGVYVATVLPGFSHLPIILMRYYYRLQR